MSSSSQCLSPLSRTQKALEDLSAWQSLIPVMTSLGSPSIVLAVPQVQAALTESGAGPDSPITRTVAALHLDSVSAMVLTVLTGEAASPGAGGGLTLLQIQARICAADPVVRLSILQCLEVASPLRESNLLQSDGNSDRAERLYRLEPSSQMELLGFDSDARVRSHVQSVTELSARASALLRALRREDRGDLVWRLPVPGGWCSVGARAREVRQLLDGPESDPMVHHLSQVAGPSLGQKAALAFLVVAGREGWGPQPWSLVNLFAGAVAGVDSVDFGALHGTGHLRMIGDGKDDNPSFILRNAFLDVVGKGPLRVPVGTSGTKETDTRSEAPSTLYRAAKQKATLFDLVLPAAQREELKRALDSVWTGPILDAWEVDEAAKGRTAPVVILLSGPPGTGKTFAAEAIAGELERPLLRARLSELLSKWLGETEQRLAGLFEAARKKKAVLLLDEVDALLASRGSGQHHDDRFVNLLLMELESTKGFVILTTNRSELLDEALARRVTAHLVLERPARAERIEIWMRYLPKKAPYAGNVNIAELADLPLSGAEIRKACIDAARRAVSRVPEAREIRQQDLVDAARAAIRPQGGRTRVPEVGFARASV